MLRFLILTFCARNAGTVTTIWIPNYNPFRQSNRSYLRLSRRLTQTVKTLFPSNDKCFLPIRQQFYAGIVGKAEAGNAGEQPAKE
jgi:hypothetical protein